jgi:hypothetical protein
MSSSQLILLIEAAGCLALDRFSVLALAVFLG